MKGLGYALLGICAAFIGLLAVELMPGFEPPFGLQKTAVIIWIVVLICALFASGLICSIIGIVKTWGEITPKQRERDQKLKSHFQEMQNGSSGLIPTLQVHNGLISPTYAYVNNFLNKFPPEWAAHFPQEDKAWGSLVSSVDANNKRHKELIGKINGAFESVGLGIVDSPNQRKAPCIMWHIYEPLFKWWNGNREIDFTQITLGDFSPPVYDLYVCGYKDAPVAFAKTEEEQDKCRSAIRSLAFNANYQKDAADLVISSSELLNAVDSLRSQLVGEVRDISTYWPGTTNCKFKKVDNCPTCGRLKL